MRKLKPKPKIHIPKQNPVNILNDIANATGGFSCISIDKTSFHTYHHHFGFISRTHEIVAKTKFLRRSEDYFKDPRYDHRMMAVGVK